MNKSPHHFNIITSPGAPLIKLIFDSTVYIAIELLGDAIVFFFNCNIAAR